MDVNDYLIDPSNQDWVKLLQEWRWLLPEEFGIWLFTRTGDLFIKTQDGAVHFLDVGAGDLRQIAASTEEACDLFDVPDNADEWLMIPIVDELVAAGHVVGPDQCYGFKLLPVLGGGYEAANRVPISISEHFGFAGSVIRQCADLPDGSKVVIEVKE